MIKAIWQIRLLTDTFLSPCVPRLSLVLNNSWALRKWAHDGTHSQNWHCLVHRAHGRQARIVCVSFRGVQSDLWERPMSFIAAEPHHGKYYTHFTNNQYTILLTFQNTNWKPLLSMQSKVVYFSVCTLFWTFKGFTFISNNNLNIIWDYYIFDILNEP